MTVTSFDVPPLPFNNNAQPQEPPVARNALENRVPVVPRATTRNETLVGAGANLDAIFGKEPK